MHLGKLAVGAKQAREKLLALCLGPSPNIPCGDSKCPRNICCHPSIDGVGWFCQRVGLNLPIDKCHLRTEFRSAGHRRVCLLFKEVPPTAFVKVME